MSTSNKVEFVRKDHELYDIRFNGESVGLLYKSDKEWEMRVAYLDDAELEILLTDNLSSSWEKLAAAKKEIKSLLMAYIR